MKVVKTMPVKAWSPSLQPIDLETRYQLIIVGGAVSREGDGRQDREVAAGAGVFVILMSSEQQ